MLPRIWNILCWEEEPWQQLQRDACKISRILLSETCWRVCLPPNYHHPRGIRRAINPLVFPFGVQLSAVQICNSEAREAQLMDCLAKAGLAISLILEYSDYIQHAWLQVLGWFSLYCCAIHCKTSLIGEPVSAVIWNWPVRTVHAWY